MNSQADLDRAHVWGLLAAYGPMTACEVADNLRLVDTELERPGICVPAGTWPYGKAYATLRSLARDGTIVGAGKGSGQYVLWFIPAWNRAVV